MGTVRHKGQIVLTPLGIAPDLDSPQTDSQWIKDEYNDLNYQNNPDQLYYGRQNTLLKLGKTKADYEACRNTTGYDSIPIDISDLAAGDYLCVITTGNSFFCHPDYSDILEFSHDLCYYVRSTFQIVPLNKAPLRA